MHQNLSRGPTAGFDGLICIWDISTARGAKPHLVGRIGEFPNVHLPPHQTGGIEILCVEFHATRRVVFAGGNDCKIRVRSFCPHVFTYRRIGSIDLVQSRPLMQRMFTVLLGLVYCILPVPWKAPRSF